MSKFGQMSKRVLLFLLTNILVVVTVGIAFNILVNVFDLHSYSSQIPTLLLFCALMGFAGSFISLFMSKWMAKSAMGVKIIDPRSNDPVLRQVVEKVHEFARHAGLKKMPEVGVYESPDVNAFATGPSKSNSLVAVSTGLLQRMNDNEVNGVLAHEVAHIANGDMVTMTLIQGIVNTFAFFFSRLLAGVISSNVDEKMRGIVHFVCTIIGDILFTLLGSIVVNYYSRRREFRADLGGAKFAGRNNMIAALKKLQTVYTIPLAGAEEENKLATLKISHRPSGGIAALFMTHPKLENRIAALEGARI